MRKGFLVVTEKGRQVFLPRFLLQIAFVIFCAVGISSALALNLYTSEKAKILTLNTVIQNQKTEIATYKAQIVKNEKEIEDLKLHLGTLEDSLSKLEKSFEVYKQKGDNKNVQEVKK